MNKEPTDGMLCFVKIVIKDLIKGPEIKCN